MGYKKVERTSAIEQAQRRQDVQDVIVSDIEEARLSVLVREGVIVEARTQQEIESAKV